MKRVLLAFIGFVCIINFVWAEDGITPKEYQYDCSIGASSVDDLLKGIQKAIGNFKVFKEEDIKIAHEHLKNYCCSKGYLSDCSSSSSNVPESPYLFDQLIDVSFRKLDGDPNLSYGNSLDSDGQKRREEIRKLAKDPKGKDPGEVLNLFNDYWDIKLKSEDKLSSKYNLACEEAFSIRSSFTQIFTDENTKTGYDKCMNIAATRVNNEITYVKGVMVEKGIKYLKDAMSNYLNDYFLKEKSMTLLEKLAEFQGRLGQWVQKVNGAGYCNGGSR